MYSLSRNSRGKVSIPAGLSIIIGTESLRDGIETEDEATSERGQCSGF